MRLARVIFRETSKDDLPGAYVALASDHYSLIKRYNDSWWKKPLAVWHAWRAAANATAVITLRFVSQWSSDQVDVVSRILAKVPPQLGGDRIVALSLLNTVLYLKVDPAMKPHTRALMLCTLADILPCTSPEEAVKRVEIYREAIAFRDQILAEPDKLMARRQWVRIASSVGFRFIDFGDEEAAGKHSDIIFSSPGCDLVKDALYYARWPQESGEDTSDDQRRAILEELQKRGLDEGDLVVSYYPPD
jgi:hypothetical protein